MEITQSLFEKYVPALLSPDSQLFDKLSAYLEQEAARLTSLAMDDYLTTDTLTARAVAFVCLSAAYQAVPQLDLVATPTGFGVVSNQNVAPASRERVEALREQLRRDRSDAFDRLILDLIKETDWRKTTAAQTLVMSLMFLPCHLRRYGVTLDGAPVYHEEFRKMQNRIGHAEAELEMLISRELYVRLIALQLADESERTTDVVVTIEQARLFLATRLNNSHPQSSRAIGRRLLETVRKAGFEEYLNSSTYAAQTFTPYQNEQQHPTFFFS